MKTDTIYKKGEERELKGYTPFSYQRAVHRELDNALGTWKNVVVKASRQKGKSLMIENELLRYAINYPKSKSACLSPTLKQSKKMFKEIIDAIAMAAIVQSANATDLEIVLANGSKIAFRAAEQGDALRGYTITGLLCIDEAAYIPDDIFYIVNPWCDAHKAPKLIVSTPKMKSGWFYEYYMKGIQGEKGYVSVDWCAPEFKADIDLVLPPAKLEEYRRLLPKNIFLTEYLGEFAEDGTGVFCVPEWHDYKVRMPLGWEKLWIGIDWGTGENGDFTAVVGFNERGEEVLLEYWNNISEPLDQIRHIADIIKAHGTKVQKVSAEENSIGDTFLKLLRKELRKEVEAFTTTNDTKRDAVEALSIAINKGEAKLVDDSENKLQMQGYCAELTPSGKITYNGRCCHDDICMASAIAWKCKCSYGSYCYTIIKRK